MSKDMIIILIVILVILLFNLSIRISLNKDLEKILKESQDGCDLRYLDDLRNSKPKAIKAEDKLEILRKKKIQERYMERIKEKATPGWVAW